MLSWDPSARAAAIGTAIGVALAAVADGTSRSRSARRRRESGFRAFVFEVLDMQIRYPTANRHAICLPSTYYEPILTIR